MKTLSKRIDGLPFSLKFDRTQHIDYFDWASSSILNKDLSSFLSKIDSIIMGSETESLKITPLHPSENLSAKIGLEIVKSTMLEDEKDQPEKDIKDLIQKHLNEILNNDVDKELVLKLLPEKISMQSVFKEASTGLIAKACGFPDLTIFKKFVNQYDDSNNILEIGVKYLVSLLSQSENLASDGYLHKFKDQLKKYKAAKPESSLDTLSANTKKQLDRIRNTVLRNIEFFFKYSPKRCESLSNFAERNGKYWKKFNKKEINIFKKLIYSNNSELEDILKNPSSFNISVFNCNICPSMAKPTEPNKKKKKNRYEFTTDWTAKIAVQKLAPIYDCEGVRKHWETCHGPNAITHGLVVCHFF